MQSTSPSSHLLRQAMMEAWTGSVVALGLEETVVDWALAKAAKTPAKKTAVKRILAGLLK